MSTETQFTLSRMCAITGVSRAGYYRSLEPAKPNAEEMKLREAMQQVAVEWPSYGSRRMARELEKRGWKVSRKRLQRLMREDNLLCVAKRKFVISTESGHDLAVYPNLAASMTLTDVNQLFGGRHYLYPAGGRAVMRWS